MPPSGSFTCGVHSPHVCERCVTLSISLLRCSLPPCIPASLHPSSTSSCTHLLSARTVHFLCRQSCSREHLRPKSVSHSQFGERRWMTGLTADLNLGPEPRRRGDSRERERGSAWRSEVARAQEGGKRESGRKRESRSLLCSCWDPSDRWEIITRYFGRGSWSEWGGGRGGARSVLWSLYLRSLDFSLQMPTDVPEDRLNDEEKGSKVGSASSGRAAPPQRVQWST